MAFLDESGFSTTPFVARTWAPVRHTPVLMHSLASRERLGAISCVGMRLRHGRPRFSMYFRIFRRTIRGMEVAVFLRLLARHVKGRAVVLMDNSKPHTGGKVSRFFEHHARFEREYIPTYCPELDPDDCVWAWVKKDLANFCAHNVEELHKGTRSSMIKMQRREELIEACLRQSELPCGDLLN